MFVGGKQTVRIAHIPSLTNICESFFCQRFVLGHFERVSHQNNTGDVNGHSGPAGHGGYFAHLQRCNNSLDIPTGADTFICDHLIGLPT